MTNEDSATDEIVQKAENYFESLNFEVDRGQKDELQQEKQQYEERHQELIQKHGDEHKLVKKAEEIVNRKKEELHELEGVEERQESAREELLRVTAEDFELSTEWLQTQVVEAVNHALYGQKNPSFSLFGEEIVVDDLDELGEFEKIDRAEVIIMLSKDYLGQSNHVEEQYQKLEDSASFAPFEVLAKNGTLSSSEVADKLEETKSSANNWLKGPINFYDTLIPFYRPQKGKYRLSTTGRYFFEHYYEGGVDSSKETEVEQEVDESGGEEKEETGSQVTLTDSPASPSKTNEENNGEEALVDNALTKTEDTEKKAEEMFSKVSDKSNN